ncbi:SIR2 family protein [Pedobacter kyungheensis]|uniref:SIR2 family protein n=1 Tax=Pedobacter kyungheensis TaxID=1069985 RepID=UPI000691C0D1|nr:SIR2 family protein [Pedobacter kyungheensis]
MNQQELIVSAELTSEVILKNKKLTITKLTKKKSSNKEGIETENIAEKSNEANPKPILPKELLKIEKIGNEMELLFLDDFGAIIGLDNKVRSQLGLWAYADELKRDFYTNQLQHKYNEIENLIILSGAGTSVGIGKHKKGLTMAGLWDALSNGSENKYLQLLIKKTDNYQGKDLEELLSLAGMRHSVKSDTELLDAMNHVKSFIVDECTLELEEAAPHTEFLNKIGLRPQKFPRVKVFTLNYDTLFEQAAAQERFTVIDGFTFSNPRVFNGKYFDYDIIETRHNRQDKKDSTIAKLFYLFKMHGSLTWRKNGGEIDQTTDAIPTDQRVMIFPQSNKYEHSYEQPYFEMMARFQQALRTENTLLITIGFSFYDKHISSVILESIKQNPSLNLMSVTYGEVVGKNAEYQKELHRIAEFQSRLTLIAESFIDFTIQFPENIAHRRFDVLESLNEFLRNPNIKE